MFCLDILKQNNALLYSHPKSYISDCFKIVRKGKFTHIDAFCILSCCLHRNMLKTFVYFIKKGINLNRQDRLKCIEMYNFIHLFPVYYTRDVGHLYLKYIYKNNDYRLNIVDDCKHTNLMKVSGSMKQVIILLHAGCHLFIQNLDTNTHIIHASRHYSFYTIFTLYIQTLI